MTIKNVGKVVEKAAWVIIGAPGAVLAGVSAWPIATLVGGVVGAISGKGFGEGMDSSAKFYNDYFVDIREIHDKIMK